MAAPSRASVKTSSTSLIVPLITCWRALLWRGCGRGRDWRQSGGGSGGGATRPLPALLQDIMAGGSLWGGAAGGTTGGCVLRTGLECETPGAGGAAGFPSGAAGGGEI